jgi:chromosome segregation ATPase
MDQDLLNYLAQRFSSIDQRFSSIDRRFDQVDQRFEKLEAEIREAHVAIEGLRSDVRLVVADGVANVTEQLNRHRDEVVRKFGEMEFLNRRVFEELRGSRDDHEVRIRRLEATG